MTENKTVDELNGRIREIEEAQINILSESIQVGFGQEQAKLWKESIEKPLQEKITKLEQALAVAEDTLEDIGHDQDMIGEKNKLAIEYSVLAREALEKIKAIKEAK